MSEEVSNVSYDDLVERISSAYAAGRGAAFQAVNTQLLKAYWEVGRHIVEFEQGGKDRAEYGTGLMERLSADLRLRLGRGFSRANLLYMRMFYLRYPISQKPSDELSWSHYVELLKLDDPLERGFYEQQAIAEGWSVPELKRQKAAALFLRLAAGKDRAALVQLAQKGRKVAQPQDLLREPYVFEFLKIPEPREVSETELEEGLIRHLQQFLLELGKGFTFVGRQYRITVGNTHYRVDLVFYHRILRCFVLIDLKIDEVQHHDIGQMNLYLGYFAKEENLPDDQPPIGIILSRTKDELLVEYATYQMNSQLFVQKYQLYLPDREELRREIEQTLREAAES